MECQILLLNKVKTIKFKLLIRLMQKMKIKLSLLTHQTLLISKEKDLVRSLTHQELLVSTQLLVKKMCFHKKKWILQHKDLLTQYHLLNKSKFLLKSESHCLKETELLLYVKFSCLLFLFWLVV